MKTEGERIKAEESRWINITQITQSTHFRTAHKGSD